MGCACSGEDPGCAGGCGPDRRVTADWVPPWADRGAGPHETAGSSAAWPRAWAPARGAGSHETRCGTLGRPAARDWRLPTGLQGETEPVIENTLVSIPPELDLPESPPRCRLLDDGRNEEDEGVVPVAGRVADTCTENIECSPHVFQHETGTHGQGYLGNSAWCNELPWWLGYMWPDAAARMGARSSDTDWIYLRVWMGYWYSDAYRQENELATEELPCAYGQQTWLSRIAIDADSTTVTRLVFAVAAVQHFAVYDSVLVDEAGGASYLRVRFWVGVMLHPSLWWSLDDDPRPYTYDDLAESSAEGFSDFLDPDDLGLRRLQNFMSSVLGVRAKVAWKPNREAAGGGACDRDNVTNVREYPCGGSDRQVLASTDWVPSLGWVNSVADSPQYDGELGTTADLGPVALQTTRGAAYSIVGNMVRCDVRLNDVVDDRVSLAAELREAFQCAFGSRDKVLTRIDIDYTPSTDVTGSYRVTSRRCLSSHDLMHVDEFIAHMQNRCDGDAWRELIFNRLDYRSIRDDRL